MLLSQAINKKLNWKWSNLDVNQHPYGILVLQAATLPTTPQHQPLIWDFSWTMLLYYVLFYLSIFYLLLLWMSNNWPPYILNLKENVLSEIWKCHLSATAALQRHLVTKPKVLCALWKNIMIIWLLSTSQPHLSPLLSSFFHLGLYTLLILKCLFSPQHIVLFHWSLSLHCWFFNLAYSCHPSSMWLGSSILAFKASCR